MPYRPSANGQVERYNRTLMQVCPVLCGKDPEQMGRVPPADRGSTWYTPNRLMLGRETSYTPYLTQRLG